MNRDTVKGNRSTPWVMEELDEGFTNQSAKQGAETNEEEQAKENGVEEEIALRVKEPDSTITIIQTAKIIDDAVETVQKPSCLNTIKIAVINGGKVLNIFVYAGGVSFIFATLSYEHGEGNIPLGITYAISSFIQNWPMAIQFNNDLLEKLKDLVNCSGKSVFEIVSSLGGLAAGGPATLAGLAVAYDAVAGSPVRIFSVPGFTPVGVSMFSINTFATRFMGGRDLTYTILASLRKSYCLAVPNHPQGHWYRGLSNLKSHYLRMEEAPELPAVKKNEKFEPADLATFFEAFYESLGKEGIAPGHSLSVKLNYIAGITIDISLVVFMQSLLLMWVVLQQEGLDKLEALFTDTKLEDATWGNVIYVASLCAQPNNLFYMMSAWNFRSVLKQFISQLKDLVKGINDSDYGIFKKFVYKYFAAFLIPGVLLGTAYLSGAGYAKVQQDILNKKPMPSCGEDYVKAFGWFYGNASIKLILPIFAQIASGLIANGRGSMKYLISHFDWLTKIFTKPKKEAEPWEVEKSDNKGDIEDVKEAPRVDSKLVSAEIPSIEEEEEGEENYLNNGRDQNYGSIGVKHAHTRGTNITQDEKKEKEKRFLAVCKAIERTAETLQDKDGEIVNAAVRVKTARDTWKKSMSSSPMFFANKRKTQEEGGLNINEDISEEREPVEVKPGKTWWEHIKAIPETFLEVLDISTFGV